MVNQYMRELSARGFVRVGGDTNRSPGYRLTPHGADRPADLLGKYRRALPALIREFERWRLERFVTRELRDAAA